MTLTSDSISSSGNCASPGLFDYKGGRYQLNGTERIRASRVSTATAKSTGTPTVEAGTSGSPARDCRAHAIRVHREGGLRQVPRVLGYPTSCPTVGRARPMRPTPRHPGGPNLFLTTTYFGHRPGSNYFSGRPESKAISDACRPRPTGTLASTLDFEGIDP